MGIFHNIGAVGVALAVSMVVAPPIAAPQGNPNAKAQPSERAKGVFNHWTSDRIASAVSRDIIFDDRNLPFVRGPEGKWNPHKHENAWKGKPEHPRARPAPTVSTDYPIVFGDTVALDEWSRGGDIQTTVGRIFFEMPLRRNLRRWAGYVCSGSVVTDNVSGRSIILTAAHCIFDDRYGAFARNVLFIPNQAQTTGSDTDLNCSNDPVGCWTPNFGVIGTGWASSSDPYAWDFGYYVVSDSGEHFGAPSASDALDQSVRAQMIDFSSPVINDGQTGAGTPDFTHALGYPNNLDPKFMLCAQDTTTINTQIWLSQCLMQGGSSGGPWVQPMNVGTGSGSIISVNSYGFLGAQVWLVLGSMMGRSVCLILQNRRSFQLFSAKMASRA